MKKLSFFLILLLNLNFSYTITLSAKSYNSNADNRLTAGIIAGIGFPRIPLSHHHTPFSITGGLFTNYNISSKFALNLSCNGLYTFNLGSVFDKKSELKFNLFWISASINYKIKDTFSHKTFISAGLGGYNLFQQFDQDSDRLKTKGINIGIITYNQQKEFNYLVEIKWHLLFKPDPNPQVLNIRFGLFL